MTKDEAKKLSEAAYQNWMMVRKRYYELMKEDEEAYEELVRALENENNCERR